MSGECTVLNDVVGPPDVPGGVNILLRLEGCS